VLKNSSQPWWPPVHAAELEELHVSENVARYVSAVVVNERIKYQFYE